MRARMFGSDNPNYKGKVNINCLTCGQTFEIFPSKVGKKKYCSRSCLADSQRKPGSLSTKKKDGTWSPRKVLLWKALACAECGSRGLRNRHSRFCVNCGPKGILVLGGRIRTCVICAAQFKSLKLKKTCSQKCAKLHSSKRQLGCLSPKWEGGKTSAAMQIRNSYQYSQWRRAVFDRDDYTCQKCNQRGGRLDADHIKPFSTHPDLRFDLTNGRTLCRSCHVKTETWGIKAKFHGNAKIRRAA